MIANEFGEAANDAAPQSALFAAGLVLFVLTLLVNIIARWFVVRGARGHRGTGGGAAVTSRPQSREAEAGVSALHAAMPEISARRRRTDKVMRGSLLVATVIALVPLVLIIYYLLHKGLSAVDYERLLHDRSRTANFFGNPGGIRSAILGTLEIVALATADRGPDRDRRRAVPDRVRQAVAVRERRALLRRRDDRRAVDRVRPVHLHRARARHVGGRLHRRGRARSRWRC